MTKNAGQWITQSKTQAMSDDAKHIHSTSGNATLLHNVLLSIVSTKKEAIRMAALNKTALFVTGEQKR